MAASSSAAPRSAPGRGWEFEAQDQRYDPAIGIMHEKKALRGEQRITGAALMGTSHDPARKDAGGRPAYALGHSELELQRLSVQARLIGPITRRFLIEAGLGEGMRVLDVGSGAVDVAFLAAELVGATGEVVGTDRSGAALAVARERATEMSFSTVTFRQGDPTEMVFERPFDAVICRYVLMYQPDPAASLTKLAAHVRPGGIVVFHEPYRDNVRSYPPVAAYDRGWELVDETLRRSGADPLLGIKLHAAFLAAGLPAPTMRMESVIAGGARVPIRSTSRWMWCARWSPRSSDSESRPVKTSTPKRCLSESSQRCVLATAS